MTELIENLSKIMQSEVKALSYTAQNGANVNTVGYKASRIALTDPAIKTESNIPVDTVEIKTGYDLAQGTLKTTGNRTDFALTSPGWFGIETPDGVRLTRRGDFQINSEGNLVDFQGYPVMSTDGIISGLEGNDITIQEDGEIFSAGQPVGVIRIFASVDSKSLKALGNGYFETTTALNDAVSPSLIQGALEMSNVDMSADMVRLMETTRHIETLQRAMSSYDQLLNIGINQIGK